MLIPGAGEVIVAVLTFLAVVWALTGGAAKLAKVYLRPRLLALRARMSEWYDLRAARREVRRLDRATRKRD